MDGDQRWTTGTTIQRGPIRVIQMSGDIVSDAEHCAHCRKRIVVSHAAQRPPASSMPSVPPIISTQRSDCAVTGAGGIHLLATQPAPARWHWSIGAKCTMTSPHQSTYGKPHDSVHRGFGDMLIGVLVG